MSRHPPRLASSEYIGPAIGFVTFSTYQRSSLLASPALCIVVLDQIRRASATHRVALLAYCLMPDHVHLLGRIEPGHRLTAWASTCKQLSAFAARSVGVARLWQTSYFDRMLRDEDSVLDVAAYVLANPVRARLAMQVGEYVWAGSDVYAVADLKSAIQSRPNWW